MIGKMKSPVDDGIVMKDPRFLSCCVRSVRMKKIVRLLIVASLSLPFAASAQRTPHIGYVYPAGGRQGTSFVVTLGGQSLDGVTNVFVSGTKVAAKVLKHERQVTPQQQDSLVKELSTLREKRRQGGLSDAEENRATEIRTTLNRFGRQLANPALNEFVTLQVVLAPDAEIGKREIRLETTVGLSNPLTFCVDDLPEFSKPDWKNIPKGRESMDADLNPIPPEKSIALPIILNGQIQPGGEDKYRFTAKRGQKLTVIASARELLPYLADAVPGWLQAVLTLYDANGKELEYDDDFRFHPDPVLLFKIPADGEYVLQIRDALHRGREDFVYRVAAGELPFITGIFPLGGKSGGQNTVAISGWNLTQNETTLNLRDESAGRHPFSVRGNGRPSNRVPFAVDTLPEIFEQEPNNSQTNAQAVTLPVIINGRIEQPGDIDCFRFDGRAGEKLVAEVLARRLDSSLDSYLKLTDAAGRQIAFNDDHEDKGSGLDTHHADSYLAVTLPSNGVYFVSIGDTQHGGGATFGYRIRLREPRPDFELRVAPSGINVRGGTSVPISIFALRKDGFAGEISVTLKNAPEGFALAGARVPANQDKVKITLAVPPVAMGGPVNLQIEGRAQIQGREIIRAAVPADDLIQAFAYRHLVPAQEMKVSVWGRNMAREPAKILGALPLKIPAGGTARLEVSFPTAPQMGTVEFELNDAPDGIAIQSVTNRLGKIEIVLQADAAKIKPGAEGNLIIQAVAANSPESRGDTVFANKRRVPLGALPAIPFEIIAPINFQ